MAPYQASHNVTGLMTENVRANMTESFKVAKVFHDHAPEYNGWFDNSLIYDTELAALRSLQSILPEPQLEVGVGPGRFACDLKVSFGIDPALGPLQFARQRGLKCCLGFGEELPVKRGALGTIYLLFTLCFGKAPQKIVAESCASLKRGGYLVIGMIPAGSSWGKYLAAKGEAGHTFYRYANFYSIGAVRRWLALSKMNIVESRSTLYQFPEQVDHKESPRKTLDETAGFVVLAARKDYA